MASQTRKIDIRQVGDRALVVYALLDPDTEELRYVGATPHLRTRARAHLSLRVNDTPVGRWIAELREQDKEPIFDELCRCDYWPVGRSHCSAKCPVEIFFIQQAANQHGLRLLNRQHNPLWFRDRATGNYLPVAPNAESVA